MPLQPVKGRVSRFLPLACLFPPSHRSACLCPHPPRPHPRPRHDIGPLARSSILSMSLCHHFRDLKLRWQSLKASSSDWQSLSRCSHTSSCQSSTFHLMFSTSYMKAHAQQVQAAPKVTHCKPSLTAVSAPHMSPAPLPLPLTPFPLRRRPRRPLPPPPWCWTRTYAATSLPTSCPRLVRL